MSKVVDAKSVTMEVLEVEHPVIASSVKKTDAAFRIHNTMRDVADAIRIAEGNLSKAAELLGTTRPALKRKVALNPYLQKVMEDIIDQKLDKTEDKLFEQVDMGNVTAITFTLRTIGKTRGYTEKNILEHEVGAETRSAAALIEAMRSAAREADSKPRLLESKDGEE